MSNLDQRIAEAARLGMSYGQYMAYRRENGLSDSPPPAAPDIFVNVGVCIVCGSDIMRLNRRGRPNTCSAACRAEINRRRALSRYYEKKEHPNGMAHICVVCGKAFRGEPRMKYCGKECRDIANLENTKKRYWGIVNAETVGK